MSGTPPNTTGVDAAAAKAARAYNAAADCYDDPVNAFWDRFGRRTVEFLPLQPGMRVLDVCCGSGASAIPAAQRVAPDGKVIGIDLADSLMSLARAKAAALRLPARFQRGDMLDLEFDDRTFDAVICVFGVFFAPNPAFAAREMWRVLKAGGTLAVTTWGPRLFEPGNTVFWNSIRDVRPELHRRFNPWDRITEVDPLRAMLMEAGVKANEVVAEPEIHPIRGPEDWWKIVMGTGYRGTIEQLTPAERESVRQANINALRDKHITEIEVPIVRAVAVK